MDALKKAEEEKKRAAKRLEQVESETHADTESTSPVENDSSVDEQNIAASNDAGKPISDTIQLSLEPIAKQEIVEDKIPETSVNKEESENTGNIDLEESAEVISPHSEDLTLENQALPEAFDKTREESIDLNDTTIIEGLSTEDVSAPFDDTFHGVLFEEEQEVDLYEETLPGVPAETLAKDLGGGEYHPTPVAAQTVFTASKGVGQSKTFITWAIVSVLALLAVVSFSVFYYFTITPVSRELPSPLVARGIESLPERPSVIEPVSEPGVVSGTIISPEQEAETVNTGKTVIDEETAKQIVSEFDDLQQEIAQEEAGIIEEESIQPEVSSEQEEIASLADETEESAVEEIPVEPERIVAEDIPVKPAEHMNVSKAMPLENIQLDTSLIQISKNKKPKQENIKIKEAFKAYQQGQYAIAKSFYLDVIKTEPDNRDAHLGLAALATLDNDRSSAYSHYVHLLELNPADALALNSLVALSNNPDPVSDESVIKTLIQKEGDLPYLHFSLGNIYAKQLRWAEAQQAFFDAYRLDTTNPDYVVNLAISLDHIGQYGTALDYYKTAIELSENNQARFDSRSVNNRILTLSEIIN